MAQIEVAGLGRRFGALKALDDVSFAVEAGEWLSVTGPSGSGKTTLLNILAGLDRPTAGRVRVDGEEISQLSASGLARYRRQRVGLVFQQFHLMPFLTALENVMLAQYLHSMTDRAEATDALLRVGLGGRLHHLPRQLSGGEQQRVAIARALINHPSILLADEPTGNLDAVNEALVMALLSDLHSRGHTLILVTHDPTIARRADRELRLEHGRVARPAEPGAPERPALLAELWRRLEEEGRKVSIERPGIAEMLADGLLHFRDGRLDLTATGRREAAAAVRRYRLAEALLARTLEREASDECGTVTPLSPEVCDEVEAFLGAPDTCPHGRPIPSRREAVAGPRRNVDGSEEEEAEEETA